jgi:hypothetical protein
MLATMRAPIAIPVAPPVVIPPMTGPGNTPRPKTPEMPEPAEIPANGSPVTVYTKQSDQAHIILGARSLPLVDFYQEILLRRTGTDRGQQRHGRRVPFHPQQAAEAVDAGKHVYLAKPIAVDAPGCQTIAAAGQRATAKKQVFLVDFQIRTDPFWQECVKRVQAGALGKVALLASHYFDEGFSDPPRTKDISKRFTNLIWVNDDAMGCGYIGNFDIHVIDAVIWALGRRPVSAYGTGGRFRKDPHGDSHDTAFITYTFEDGLVWNHNRAEGPTHDWLNQGALQGSIQGIAANARLSYWGKAYVRGGAKHYAGGEVADLYAAGAYLGDKPAHVASLLVQDRLRLLMVAAIIVGVVIKTLGW